MIHLRHAGVMALSLLLSACALGGGGESLRLVEIAPITGTAEAGQAPLGTLIIDMPMASRAIDTDRIALRRPPTGLDYYAGLRWSDRAPAMVQTALLRSLAQQGAFRAVNRPEVAVKADYTLKIDLNDFAAIYDGPMPVATITIMVSLVRESDRKIVAAKLIRAEEPAAADSGDAIVAAFDRAGATAQKDLISFLLSAARAGN